MAWKDVTITDAGEKLLAEMVNGSELILTRAAIGAGTVPVDELPSLTDVIKPITAPALLAGEDPTEGGKIIKIQVRNDGVAETTRMRQIAIYAKTDHEDEVLFVILQDEIGEEIPAYDEFPQFDIEQWVTLALSRTNNITVTVNPLAFVPAVEFEREVKRLDTTKADKTEISNPNLLDNWYFADPINQRGNESYTVDRATAYNEYTIDRWTLGNKGKIDLSNGGIILQKTTDDHTCNFSQQVESIKTFAGKQITFSVLLKGNVALAVTVNGAAASNLYNNSEIGICKFNYKFPDIITSNYISFTVQARDMNPITIVAAKLELGDRQTLARQEGGKWVLNDPPPNKALELAKCQMYYWISEMLFTGWCTTSALSSRLICNVQFPVKMRVRPAVTIVSSKGTLNCVSNFASQSDVELGEEGATVMDIGLRNDGFSIIKCDWNDRTSTEPYCFKVIADADL
ncbi:MAG: hypothetical protein J1F28_04505 [Oscillospiraceae bacterium]|nr:hypothetical protein [Oscillospiraceae bacterium]